MKVKDNKKIFIICSLILVFILLFLFCVFNNEIKNVKASVFELSNDNISLSINDTISENNTAEFNYMELKTMTITVDFKDFVSKNKKIEIELKEGLTYSLYPVLEKTNNEMQTLINENNSLYNAISNVSYPEIKEIGYQATNPYMYVENPSSFGVLTYDVYENISKLTISINVMVDWQKMYPDEKDQQTGLYKHKIIEDAISIRVYKNNEKINELSNNVKVTLGDLYTHTFQKSDHVYNESVFVSSGDNINYGYTSGNEFRLFSKNYNTFFAFPNYEMLEYTFYYPKGSIFKDIVYANTKNPIESCNSEDINNYCKIIDVPSSDGDNKVILRTNVFRRDFIIGISVKYQMKDIKNFAISPKQEILWESLEADKVKITYYDGVEKTYYSNKKNSVRILHPDDLINRMFIEKGTGISEDKNDNTYVYGPSFVLKNNTAGTKTNQVLEYIIDPNYQVFAVTFPRKNGMALKEIKYQINGSDNWLTYSGNNFTKHKFSIEDAGFELESNNYFTRIKAVVEKYEENFFTSSSSHSSITNAVLYGNLNSNSSSANVTFRMYEKPNKEIYNDEDIDKVTLVESTKSVTYKSELEIGSFPGILNFYSANNELINKISPNEKIQIKGKIAPHYYPYGTRLYLENAYIYLRQPKGLILDVQNISLTDESDRKIDYEIEVKENALKEKIYILKTNETIGFGLSKRDILNVAEGGLNFGKFLKLNINYYLSKNYEDNNIALNDLVSYGNYDYKFVSRGKNDDKDLNANNNTEEKIPDVSPDVLVIESKKEFSIESNVIKDGIRYDQYNQNNLDTIIEVKPNDIFEYIVDISNNTEDSIDNYEIYIPIAKKGTNYGESFQKNEFNFDVTLLETLSTTDLYDVYYSTDRDIKNIIDPKTMNYVTDISDESLVTMIKIVSKKAINMGEEFSINLKLRVDKNKTEVQGNNINNILYYMSSSTLSGEFKSNSNAFKLYAPSISGFVFNDLNVDKKFDGKDIPVIRDVSLELYKLHNENYEKVIDINVDSKSGYFVLDDANLLSKGIYALKVNVPDYYIYSDITSDGWIKDISFLESKEYYYEIGYIKYDLDFNIDNQIIGVGKKQEISIKDLKPKYFDLIKNEESAYNWYVSDEDSSYLRVNDENSPSIKIEGLKETKEDVNLCVQVVDRYNNKKEKCAKVKIKESLAPIVNAKDVHILVGSKIKYEDYLLEAIDYKGNKIELDFNKNVKVTTNIPQENGNATKVGNYDISFEVTDDYGNKGFKTIKIYVDPISAIITNPSTYDYIISNIILIIVSFVTIILTGIYIYKKRYRN